MVFGLFGGKEKGRSAARGPFGPYRHSREMNQQITEMLQVIRRVLADGVVTEEEASNLSVWTLGHPDVVEVWPGKILSHRLERIFEDGKVDDEERRDLERLLRALAGGDWGVRTGIGGSGALPLTDPPPLLIFPENEFVFAGEFAYGSHLRCQEVTRALGGGVGVRVTEDTDVLVVGTFGPEEWRESPEADAVGEALSLQGQGKEIAIVSEDYWVSFLPED